MVQERQVKSFSLLHKFIVFHFLHEVSPKRPSSGIFQLKYEQYHVSFRCIAWYVYHSALTFKYIMRRERDGLRVLG